MVRRRKGQEDGRAVDKGRRGGENRKVRDTYQNKMNTLVWRKAILGPSNLNVVICHFQMNENSSATHYCMYKEEIVLGKYC